MSVGLRSAPVMLLIAGALLAVPCSAARKPLDEAARLALLGDQARSRAAKADPGPDREMAQGFAEVSQEALRQYLKEPLRPDSPELDADSQAALRDMMRTYLAAQSEKAAPAGARPKPDPAIAQRAYRSALTFYQRALAIYERVAPHSLQAAQVLDHAAQAALGLGNAQAASAYYRRAVPIYQRRAPGSLALAKALIGAGDQQLMEPGEALKYYRPALAIVEKRQPNSAAAIDLLIRMGVKSEDVGDRKAAASYYGRARAIAERREPNSRGLAFVLVCLGDVALDPQAAKKAYQQALTIYEKLTPNWLETALMLKHLGKIAQRSGDAAAAAEYQHRVETILAAAPG